MAVPPRSARTLSCGCGNTIESTLVETALQGTQAPVYVIPATVCGYCGRPMVPPPGEPFSTTATPPASG